MRFFFTLILVCFISLLSAQNVTDIKYLEHESGQVYQQTLEFSKAHDREDSKLTEINGDLYFWIEGNHALDINESHYEAADPSFPKYYLRTTKGIVETTPDDPNKISNVDLKPEIYKNILNHPLKKGFRYITKQQYLAKLK